VTEELHYGRAAERLHITQPALSRQFRDLERVLGVSLFDRTSRRVILSRADLAVLGEAWRALGPVLDALEPVLADGGELGDVTQRGCPGRPSRSSTPVRGPHLQGRAEMVQYPMLSAGR
jgi:DNA-binding transcriptional LysR family regulator